MWAKVKLRGKKFQNVFKEGTKKIDHEIMLSKNKCVDIK
jgi:hypothetical protein